MKKSKYSNLLKAFGPGIIFATTCIGVSHLVQSTRAGADYGFQLVWAILLVNLFKYPFFEFSSRYVGATGKNILDGYFSKGKWILVLYITVQIFTIFIITAAGAFVTAGLASNLASNGWSTSLWAFIILVSVAFVLSLGKYKILDSLLKVVGFILLVSTVIAFIGVLGHGPEPHVANFIEPDVMTPVGIAFLIALMGWMPTDVSSSSWISLWTEERIKETGYRPTRKEIAIDFNTGYVISAVLAICFVTLGSYLIYGTGRGLPNSAPLFAHRLITMYTEIIGDWSYYVIAIAALSVMFSTNIAVVDGNCRTVTRSAELLFLKGDKTKSGIIYVISVIILSLGSFLVLTQYVNDLKTLIDLATIISFVIAPLTGTLNYWVITSKEIDNVDRPPGWLRIIAILGIAFLIIFTIIYFISLIIPDLFFSFFN